MIRVEISINESPIHDLSAVNIGSVLEKPDTLKHQWRRYELNCGHKLFHDRLKGALILAIQILEHAQECRLQKPHQNGNPRG